MSASGWTLLAALVSAGAAVIGILWGIYLRSADRAKLKMYAKAGFFASFRGTAPVTIVVVANTSHHPITITSAGLRLSNGEHATFTESTQPFPCRIQPGESVDAWALTNSIAEQLNERGGTNVWPTHVWASDATGKMWKRRMKRSWNLGLTPVMSAG